MPTTVFVPLVGERLFLSSYLASNNVTLRLVQSNWTSTPNAADSVTNTTVLLNITGTQTATVSELTVGPYTAQVLSSASWTYLPSWSNGAVQPVTASYQATISFSCSAAANCYGYFIHNSSGILIWEQQLSSAITVGSGGGTITIQPAITAT